MRNGLRLLNLSLLPCGAALIDNTNPLKPKNMAKYVCDLCGWEYDPEAGYPDGGIAPGTAWENIPEDFVCPLCGAGKEEFSEA